MKIKSKVISSTINNKDILDTFQELLGTSETNACLPVAHPKYVKLQTHVNRFIRLLSMYRESTALSKFPDIKKLLATYIESLEKNFNESFIAPDLEQFCVKTEETLAGHNYNSVPPETKIEFSKVFTSVKKCNIVNIIIVTCKNLLPYKKHIEDKNNLTDSFITKTPGNVINPLPDFPQMNFKRIYNDDILDNNDKSFVLMVLSKLYEISYNVYEVLSSPDVDVNEFVAVILNSVDQIKKHIPRCNEAFDKIVESVDILKVNFNSYYKDFLSSNNNAAIIMENFVLDVSKTAKATPKLTAQFRTIISHYRKVATQSNTDPRLKTLFKHVEKNFNELEKYQNEDSDAEEDEDDDGLEENENNMDTNTENTDTTIEIAENTNEETLTNTITDIPVKTSTDTPVETLTDINDINNN